jgi:chaperonin GroES
VKKTKPQEKTVGGIVLPESAMGPRNNEAQVIAVGPGARSRGMFNISKHFLCRISNLAFLLEGAVVPLTVKPGDKVLLGDFGGSEVRVSLLILMIYSNAALGQSRGRRVSPLSRR